MWMIECCDRSRERKITENLKSYEDINCGNRKEFCLGSIERE